MLNKEKICETLKSHREILKKYHVSAMYLFGSYGRDEATEKSDIDLFFEYDEAISYFELIELEEYLEKLFSKKIDLGTKKSLHHLIKHKILEEATRVF